MKNNKEYDRTINKLLNIKQIKLPRLISDGMVIQRNSEVKIWGWAPVNQKVTVCFLDKEYSTITDNDGRWYILLPALKAGGPYKMVINGANSNSNITINDILIGDVWVCSGQSNMEIPMYRVRDLYKDEIIHCKNKNIRQFGVSLNYNFNLPEQDLDTGRWESADPDSILQFTAVGYFFAKSIYEKYNVPIGLIKASVGGSPIEAWLSEEALKDFPEHLKTLNKYKDKDFVKKIEKNNNESNRRWYKKIYYMDKGLKNDLPWFGLNYDHSEWSSMELPASFDEEGLDNFNGVIWFRKEIDLPASMANKPARLWMGRIVDGDTAYFNGKHIGSTSYQYPPRKYDIPGGLLKKGKNVITLRVVSNNGQGAFIEDKPYKLIIGEQEIDLKGTWYYKVGAAVEEPLPDSEFVQWKPSGLFNGMAAPLGNYAIKGVTWYQGEANVSKALEYQKLFPALINDWRRKWNQGKFPFLYVQLPNYGEVKDQPSESEWAELREAQLKGLTVSNTAMAVAIDLGEWNDLHPLNKKDVGRRLALAAQNIAYGDRDVVYSGPIYKSMEVEGQSIKLSFTNIGSGLSIKNGNKLKGFAIAGSDKKFVRAEAEIKGDQVVVGSTDIDNPVAVRYAWADNPEGANLYNKEGLPASPFRTDI